MGIAYIKSLTTIRKIIILKKLGTLAWLSNWEILTLKIILPIDCPLFVKK